MNREFIFRAWNGEEMSQDCNVFSDNSFVFWSSENIFVNDAEMNNLKTMELTPFLDSKNNKLFEGDVVQYSTWGKSKIIKVVEFCEQMGWLPFNDWDHIQDEQGDAIKQGSVKLLGNIYENPELLNK